jgi:4-hydroxy-3-polyprenylbenzoate decarboxylase
MMINPYHDLRDFIAQLEQLGELKRIRTEVSPHLEMTEICDRTCARVVRRCCSRSRRGIDDAGARQPVRHARRVALGMGEDSVEALREVGKLLAFLKEPEPPKGLKDAWDKLPVFRKVLNMAPEGASRRRPARRSSARARMSISGSCRCRPAGPATPAR